MEEKACRSHIDSVGCTTTVSPSLTKGSSPEALSDQDEPLIKENDENNREKVTIALVSLQAKLGAHFDHVFARFTQEQTAMLSTLQQDWEQRFGKLEKSVGNCTVQHRSMNPADITDWEHRLLDLEKNLSGKADCEATMKQLGEHSDRLTQLDETVDRLSVDVNRRVNTMAQEHHGLWSTMIDKWQASFDALDRRLNETGDIAKNTAANLEEQSLKNTESEGRLNNAMKLLASHCDHLGVVIDHLQCDGSSLGHYSADETIQNKQVCTKPQPAR